MSPLDGAPSWVVEAEHLEDRRVRFWLLHDGGRQEVPTLEGVGGCYPVVKRAVRAVLALPDDFFIVSLRIPRPPYVHDGHTVVVEEEGRSYRGG